MSNPAQKLPYIKKLNKTIYLMTSDGDRYQLGRAERLGLFLRVLSVNSIDRTVVRRRRDKQQAAAKYNTRWPEENHDR